MQHWGLGNMGRSEDTLPKLVLFFHPVESRQAVRLGSKCLYLLSHLASPSCYFDYCSEPQKGRDGSMCLEDAAPKTFPTSPKSSVNSNFYSLKCVLSIIYPLCPWTPAMTVLPSLNPQAHTRSSSASQILVDWHLVPLQSSFAFVPTFFSFDSFS